MSQIEHANCAVISRNEFDARELPADGFYCINEYGEMFAVNPDVAVQQYVDRLPPRLAGSYAPLPQTWPTFEYLAEQAMQ